MEHAFPPESFQQENRTTFSKSHLFPGIFQWNAGKTCVPLTSQAEFLEFLGEWHGKSPLFFWTECSKRKFVFHFFNAIFDTSFRPSPSFFCNWNWSVQSFSTFGNVRHNSVTSQHGGLKYFESEVKICRASGFSSSVSRLVVNREFKQ